MSSSISSFDRTAWRRFFRLAAGTAAGILGFVFAFVALVDPWDALPLSPPLDRAPVTSNQRYAYPALARSRKFDSAVIGTSTSRLLRPAQLNEAFHARFANLAMNAATPWEQLRLLEVFARAHPHAKTIILGLDTGWCETGDAPARLTPRPFPGWMYRSSAWRGYREILNLYAVEEAAKEFGVLTGLKREDQGRDGYTVFVPPDDKWDRERAMAKLRADGPAIPLGVREGPPSTWRFRNFEDLRETLRTLPPDTETILFFVPAHRVRIPPADHPAAAVWTECRRRAVDAVRDVPRAMVADFFKLSALTNDDDGFWDALHYRVAVADRLARGLAAARDGDTSPDFDILTRRR